MSTAVNGLKAELEGVLSDMDADDKSNQEAAATVKGLVSNEYANVMVM